MYRQEASDAMVQARVKSTTLATVARFFALKGVILQSKSFLMRLTFERILIKNGLAERVTDIIDARTILSRLGLDNFNPGGRLGRNFMEEQQRAVYDYEGWDTKELTADRTKANVASEIEEMEELAKSPEQLLQRMEEHLAPRVNKQAERSKAEHDALGDVSGVEVVEEEQT